MYPENFNSHILICLVLCVCVVEIICHKNANEIILSQLFSNLCSVIPTKNIYMVIACPFSPFAFSLNVTLRAQDIHRGHLFLRHQHLGWSTAEENT